MNNKLKKDAGKLAGYAYQKNYMKNHTKVCISLDNKEDADIIKWLKEQKNRSEAVRKSIRERMTWTNVKCSDSESHS